MTYKRAHLLLAVTTIFIYMSQAQAQGDFLANDYRIFGRKEPVSPGSVFSALNTSTILINPATLAFVTDNRINIGQAVSGIGDGRFISWMAPNLSISSARQDVERTDPLFGFQHEKQSLHFAFGVSTMDLGMADANSVLGLGIAIKRRADRLAGFRDGSAAGGHAVSVDVGMLYRWRQLELELVLVDINSPKLKDSNLSYGAGFIVGGRYTTPTGLTIGLQGTGGSAYSGSDFGLSFAAEQRFMDGRLIPRIQLTSFFSGSEATMQNISASLGYRLNALSVAPSVLKDLEFSYALSFLALPNNVGTHMVVVTKYF